MKSNSQKRLLIDLKKLLNDAPEGIEAAPVDHNDIFTWEAVIIGPQDTPWENGIFKLKMKFSEDYPSHPPEVAFKTPIFHPNVYRNGDICLDILKSNWSPVFDVSNILVSIQSLLNDPNPKSPANGEAAKLFEEDRAEYYRKVRQIIEKNLEADDSDASEPEDAKEEMLEENLPVTMTLENTAPTE